MVIRLLQLDDRIHQRFRHILPAVYAKSSFTHGCPPLTSARHTAHFFGVLDAVRFDPARQVERIRARLHRAGDIAFV